MRREEGEDNDTLSLRCFVSSIERYFFIFTCCRYGDATLFLSAGLSYGLYLSPSIYEPLNEFCSTINCHWKNIETHYVYNEHNTPLKVCHCL